MAEVTMPRLSDTMEEGTIGRWLKQPGDHVDKGEVLLEIETDKATMELESYESGTLQKILVQEGQTVPIGEPIAVIGEGAADDTQSPAAGPSQASAAAAGTQQTDAPPRSGTPTEEGGAAATARTSQPEGRLAAPPGPEIEARGYNRAAAAETITEPHGNGRATDERIIASPVARRIAEEYGIDLRQVQGTGPGGRIIKENVEEFQQRQGQAPAKAVAQPAAAQPAQPEPAAPQPTPQPAPAAQAARPAPAPAPAPAAQPAGEVTPMSRMRRAIARKMTESKPGVPHIYVTSEIDMGEALKWRKQINDSGVAPVKISVNDMIVKATARALLKFPSINSSFATTSDGQAGYVQHKQINISVAVAIDEGLIAPTIVDADKKSLGTIATEIRDLAARARDGKIKPNEIEGGTFTVSNLGMFDVVEFGMIITPPQAGAIAVGAVRQVPVVRDGEIVIGEMMHASVSVDHRIVDGAIAAQFMQELKRLLQSPMSLLL